MEEQYPRDPVPSSEPLEDQISSPDAKDPPFPNKFITKTKNPTSEPGKPKGPSIAKNAMQKKLHKSLKH